MEHGCLNWSVGGTVGANAQCGLVFVFDRVAYVMGRISLLFAHYNNRFISTRSLLYAAA